MFLYALAVMPVSANDLDISRGFSMFPKYNNDRTAAPAFDENFHKRSMKARPRAAVATTMDQDLWTSIQLANDANCDQGRGAIGQLVPR